MEDFFPEIPEATRLNQKASFEDTSVKDKVQEYKLMEERLGSNYKVRSLNAAKVKQDKYFKPYPFQVSLGLGNLIQLKGIYSNI